jgi:predicted transposase/invertase (TIGR01784 family)
MSNKKFLPVKSDIIFHLFFADERNMEALISFLKAVLKLPADDYNEITIVDPHLLREYPGDKLGILDVKLKSKSGKIINIEIQVKPMPGMKNRIVFYVGKLITEQIGDGDDYEEIKKVISIAILNYDFIAHSANYHHRFVLYDIENQVVFNDDLEIHTLELSKLGEADGTELWDWLKFIDAETEEELAVVAERSPQMKKAVARLMELSDSERARMLYEAREKEQRDNRARERGARQDERIFIAKNALKKKMPVEDIIDITGLRREEVESLCGEATPPHV